MSRGPLRGGLRPVLTDSRLTSAARSVYDRTQDRLAPVCPPLAGLSTPGSGTNALGPTVCALTEAVFRPETITGGRGEIVRRRTVVSL